MSSSGAPPSGDPPPKTTPPPIVDDTIVAQARAQMGGFFSKVITSLGQDAQDRIKSNNGPPSQVSIAVNEFTVQMIDLLAARVSSALPQTAPMPPAAPSASPPADPPPADTPATKKAKS
jgi:hypothetical protein